MTLRDISKLLVPSTNVAVVSISDGADENYISGIFANDMQLIDIVKLASDKFIDRETSIALQPDGSIKLLIHMNETPSSNNELRTILEKMNLMYDVDRSLITPFAKLVLVDNNNKSIETYNMKTMIDFIGEKAKSTVKSIQINSIAGGKIEVIIDVYCYFS